VQSWEARFLAGHTQALRERPCDAPGHGRYGRFSTKEGGRNGVLPATGNRLSSSAQGLVNLGNCRRNLPDAN
jgi:hypothetical protein